MHGVIRKKLIVRALLLTCGVIPVGLAQASTMPYMGPLEASGFLGYYYRSYTEDAGTENVSHQLAGTVNASTYFGEPWLATANLALSLTQDSSESTEADSQSSVDSQLITGDFGLNVLPQSRTPFGLNLQLTDSRVDTAEAGLTPITFVGEEYSTMYLGLRQSFMTQNGGRLRFNYDLRNWESTSSGEYDDETLGAEVDLRKPQQHLIARGSMQTNEHAVSERLNENLVLDLSHFYYPVRNFRLDSKVSYYDSERSFLDPLAVDKRLTSYDMTQLSSNAFWRPGDYPLSFTAGVRVFSSESSEGDNSGSDLSNLTLNSGVFYQVSQNLRLDANFSSLYNEENGVQRDVHRQAGGLLYQADLAEVYGFMYQAYLDGDFVHNVDVDDDIYSWSFTLGHGLARSWWPAERTSMTSLRLNINQALGYDGAVGDTLSSSSFVGIDHSASLSFNQQAWGGNSLAQLTLSDSRSTGSKEVAAETTDTDFEQQLINLQLSRDQDLGRRSSITGDITVQYVRVKNEAVVDESDTTTSTGRIMFQHYQMLGVPRLQFSSDYIVSNTSTEGAIDRSDWENRLSYMIGKMDTSVSYRLTETDSRNYDLLYFRLMRRF